MVAPTVREEITDVQRDDLRLCTNVKRLLSVIYEGLVIKVGE
jgi:hypothetical protein